MAKTKLNKPTAKAIIDGVKIGVPGHIAAEAVGVDKTTYWKWLKRGEKSKKGLFFDFFHQIKSAQYQSIKHAVVVMRTAMKDTWQAAAWWLERQCSEEFGKKVIIEPSAMEDLDLSNPDKALSRIASMVMAGKLDDSRAKLLIDLVTMKSKLRPGASDLDHMTKDEWVIFLENELERAKNG
jgi:hypothetical protein